MRTTKASGKTARAGIAMIVVRAGRAPNAAGFHRRVAKATGAAQDHAEIAPEDRARVEIAHATGDAMIAATMIARPARRHSRHRHH